MVFQTINRDKDDPAFVRVMRVDPNGSQSEFDIEMDDLAKKDTVIAELYKNLVVFDVRYYADIWRFLLTETRNLTRRKVITYLSKEMGWTRLPGAEEAKFILGPEKLSSGESVIYRDSGIDFVAGSAADYERFLQDEVYGVKTMEFALILGLTSIVSGYVSERTKALPLAVNISSRSTSGKTTIFDFIGSLYGSPSHSNSGLVRTFNATKNAIMANCEGRNGIPIILDDINSNASEHNRIDMVMQLVGGTSRGRCSSTGAAQAQRPSWHGVALISSESPIFDGTVVTQGVTARCLTIDNVIWTKDAPHSDRIKKAVGSCYGHVAKGFAEIVAAKGKDSIIKALADAESEILSKMKVKDHLSARLASEMAPFLVAAHLYQENCLQSLMVDEITDMLIAAEQASHEEGSLADRMMEKLRQFILSNRANFLYRNEGIDNVPKGKCYGSFGIGKDKSFIVSVLKEEFERFLKDAGCSERLTILREWASKEMILHEKEHYYTKDPLQGYVRCLRIPFKSYSDFGIKPIEERTEPEVAPEAPIVQTEYHDEEAINAIFAEDDRKEQNGNQNQ